MLLSVDAKSETLIHADFMEGHSIVAPSGEEPLMEATEPLLPTDVYARPELDFKSDSAEEREPQTTSFSQELQMQSALAAPLCLSNLLRFSLGSVSIAIIGHLDPQHLPDAAIGTSFSNVTLLSGTAPSNLTNLFARFPRMP